MTLLIILDSQLLVLLAVGKTSEEIISKHKRLTEFTSEDFHLLIILLGDKPNLRFLPNVASEASNLIRQHIDPEKSAIMRTLRNIIDRNQEGCVWSRIAAARPEYTRLGLTDSAILQFYTPADEILTADAELYFTATRSGMTATNFNHKREEFGAVP